MKDDMPRVRVIDSHTGGEPTRIVLDGGPDLGGGDLATRLRRMREHHDAFRSAIVNEPRGSDVLVGGLLCPPSAPDCITGVIFFNNVGYLGMCGHGTIGLAVTLAHLGRLEPGEFRLDTPVGPVRVWLEGRTLASFENVPSFRLTREARVDVEGFGPLHGDIAWGGNWFFIVDQSEHRQPLTDHAVQSLTDFCWRVRQGLAKAGVRGAGGVEIDHIELCGPPADPANSGRNFVLCPGKAYDRSPCGTGTSAKVACLHADGKLRPGETWRQESIIGSVFEATFRMSGEQLLPRIRGRAYVTGDASLVLDPTDPFRHGIRSTTGGG